ncbi:MAG: hypothetical protein L0387_14800 [Acidobacteria bacterium]|nr:hypothetical protein [Acidobacteriota bacterium]MCI0622900.1 hypothetical protein [Acidobacteriota bacterium]
MDKIMSARLEEAALLEMERITRKLGISKKRFLEEAIHRHAQTLTKGGRTNDWTVGFGAWKRNETAAQTTKAVRGAFNQSLERNRR